MTQDQHVGRLGFVGCVNNVIIAGFHCWGHIKGAKYDASGTNVKLLDAQEIADTLIWNGEGSVATVIIPVWLQ